MKRTEEQEINLPEAQNFQEDDENWLMKSVSRVKREVLSFFGSHPDDKDDIQAAAQEDEVMFSGTLIIFTTDTKREYDVDFLVF